MRVSQNIACLQGRMIWGWLWLGPGWDNFKSPHSNYELNLFPASSTQDDTRMPSTFWGHCSQDDSRMIFEKFCFKQKSKEKITIILFSRMLTTQIRMSHPKIACHPGFMDRPDLGRQSQFWDLKAASQGLQKWPQGVRIDPKGSQRGRKNDSKPGPADCAKRVE